ncbi:MAG TPA: hypothetical protein DIT03_09295, partial [Candidatus Accumulibacter sp.]|nr:hypothetical protein [Accumulibacter sp.]
MSWRLTIGPFNRVEGDLEVWLDVSAGRVVSAQVSSTLYRGFEHVLIGKQPRDALVIVPRICGICSVSQSAAAATALAEAAGLEMPANGRLASNLILACENLADHLTHFYLICRAVDQRECHARVAVRRAGAAPGCWGDATAVRRVCREGCRLHLVQGAALRRRRRRDRCARPSDRRRGDRKS